MIDVLLYVISFGLCLVQYRWTFKETRLGVYMSHIKISVNNLPVRIHDTPLHHQLGITGQKIKRI